MENEVSLPPDFQRFWELHNTDYLHGREQMDRRLAQANHKTLAQHFGQRRSRKRRRRRRETRDTDA